MTIEEAKQAAIKGNKITHRFFLPDEYIGLTADGQVYTEDKRYSPVPWNWFMEQRNSVAWMIDWSIWTDTKTDPNNNQKAQSE